MLGFSIGLKALRAAQQSMDVVGQNVANASTPGYSRRLSQLSATAPMVFGRFGVGTGVQVNDIRRAHDDLLESRLREQHHVLGRLDSSGSLLRQLEGFFQEPSDNGLAARLDDLWSTFSDLTRSAGDSSYRDGLVQSAQTLSAGFRQVSSQVDSVGVEARHGVESAVSEVNGLLGEIAAVNQRVIKARTFGSTPGDILDERNRLLQSLSDWVDTQVIDRPDGTVDVLIDGMLMASGDRARSLTTRQPADGTLQVLVKEGQQAIEPNSGRLKGFVDLVRDTVPKRRADLDAIARQLLLEVNRLHTTAISSLGPNTQLGAAVSVDPGQTDDPLAPLDLPFMPTAGRLTVNVVASATGEVSQHFVDIDPQSMSLEDLATALSAIPHLSASLDSVGRLRIASEQGYGFDFSSRIDGDPDDAGSFGSDQATLTSGVGPFALADGDTLDVAVDGGAPITVTFSTSDFADITQATAAEVMAVIQQQASGVSATTQDGRLVLASNTAGTASTLQIVAASSSALFTAGASDVGSAQTVKVSLDGAPTDGRSGHFTVRALGDGVIGLTPGLAVELLDENGAAIGSVDVGSGYTPGDPIEIVPGVRLTLSAGAIQQSAGDLFEFDLVGDSDSADILVALQLGSFFTGGGAADFAVADEIASDPRRVAGSRNGDPSDSSNFFALVGLKDAAIDALSGRTFSQTYGDLVAGIGLDVRANGTATSAQTQLLTSLEARRDEISGVNTDEETLKLLEYQHLYQAAGRYLQAVNEMNDALFQML